METSDSSGQAECAYISTGHLPSPEHAQKLVEAYERFHSDTSGQNSQVYPALARVPSDPFGICVVGIKGEVHAVGVKRLCTDFGTKRQGFGFCAHDPLP